MKDCGCYCCQYARLQSIAMVAAMPFCFHLFLLQYENPKELTSVLAVVRKPAGVEESDKLYKVADLECPIHLPCGIAREAMEQAVSSSFCYLLYAALGLASTGPLDVSLTLESSTDSQTNPLLTITVCCCCVAWVTTKAISQRHCCVQAAFVSALIFIHRH